MTRPHYMDLSQMPRWLLARLGLGLKTGRPKAPETVDPDALNVEKKGPERGTLAWWRERWEKIVDAAPSDWARAKRRLAEAFHFLGSPAAHLVQLVNRRRRPASLRVDYPIPLPPTHANAPARLRRRLSRYLARAYATQQASGKHAPIRVPREMRWPR